MTAVSAPSRLHLGLLDLGRATSRTFGGVGLMLGEPTTLVDVEPALEIVVEGNAEPDELRMVEQAVRRFIAGLPGTKRGVRVSILSAPKSHVGLGRRTSVVLASLAAASISMTGEVRKSEVQSASGRGGTSGIGINGFFSGGFVIDGGHPGTRALLPSSMQSPTTISPVLIHHPLPETWKVALFEVEGTRFSDESERTLFESTTPLPPSEVKQAISLLFMGMLPALIESDLSSFGAAYARFSRTGMKAREIKAQGAGMRRVLDYLSDSYACYGMSSVGPTAFGVFDSSAPDLVGLPPNVVGVDVTQFSSGGYTVHE